MRSTHVLIEGKEYLINTDYRVALECVELVNDTTISDYERAIGVVTMLFGEECPICEEAISKVELYLSMGEKESKTEEQVLDFQQDRDFIYSAFMAQYSIDLDIQDLHYEQFIDLLRGVKNQILNDVVSIREQDLSDIKDPKHREELRKVKERVQLKPKVSTNVSNSAFYRALEVK